MRKLFALITIALLFFTAKPARAQYVAIPDTNFRNWLVQNYPSCMSGGMMDTTCISSYFIEDVTIRDLYISSLEGIQFFRDLKLLDCTGNNITALPPLPDSLIILHCAVNLLNTIPVLPNGLDSLYLFGNPITNIAVLPANLKVLDCTETQLTTLPTLPSGLEKLYAGACLLTTLPPLPPTLTLLQVSANQITALPALPNSLRLLEATSNILSGLPTLSDSLKHLDVSQNHLSTLPSLPIGLIYLRCGRNQLTSLPVLPSSIEILECFENAIDSLPELPVNLRLLMCFDNNIHELPVIPDSLRSLYCGENPISYIPVLTPVLKTLGCDSTLISSLPSLQNLTTLYCNDNPNLTCLPDISGLQHLDFTNTGILCVPSYNTVNSTPPLQTFPLCNIFSSTCEINWNIAGSIFVDADSNCVQGFNSSFSNAKITLYDNGGNLLQQYQSNYGNAYSFKTNVGNYVVSIDTSYLPLNTFCPDSGYYNSAITLADSIDSELNFALVCKPGFDVGVTSVVNPTGVIRPANNAEVAIYAGDISNFYNAHCAAGVSGVVQVIINGPASYVSSNALPVSVLNGDTLTWNIADFGTVDFNSDFNITIHTDTLAQIGQQVCFDVMVTPTAGDNNITNNTLTHCFDVVNSYDPNDKTAYPSGDIDTATEWLTYTIRFQNTGNAPAQHIYVLDTLDSDVDVSTFKLLAYSHDNITQVLPGGIVKFNFPNINLPDSFSNEPASHGYVQYKIKLKDNLPLGTTISNTAFIYFDFNAPVVTNTAVNTITNNVGLGNVIKQDNLQITLLPNPAHNTVTVQLQNITANSTLKVFDVLGSLVKQQSIQQSNTTIDISTLQAGIYFVQLETANGRGVKRLVVSR